MQKMVKNRLYGGGSDRDNCICRTRPQMVIIYSNFELLPFLLHKIIFIQFLALLFGRPGRVEKIVIF